jgi:hypothetical protein
VAGQRRTVAYIRPIGLVPSRKRTAGRNLGTGVSPSYDSFEPRNITGHLDHWIRPLLLESDKCKSDFRFVACWDKLLYELCQLGLESARLWFETSRDPGSDDFNIDFEISRVCTSLYF